MWYNDNDCQRNCNGAFLQGITVIEMNKKEKVIDYISFICIFGLFAYFAIFHETYEYEDSFQYVRQHPMREPVYSLFMQFLQFMVKDGYKVLTGVLQNILAVVCTYWAYYKLCKMYKLNSIFRIGTMGALLSPHVITPLVSRTHIILTNSILTEGITVSLYYVWIVIMLEILGGEYADGKEFLKLNIQGIIIALVLAMTRGQMAICLVLWLIVIFYKTVREYFMERTESNSLKKMFKRIACCIILVAIVFCVKTQLTKIYNLLETGYFVNTISSKPMLLANVVYVCDETDADFIKDAEKRETFKTIVANAKADKLSVEFASGSIIDKALYHESCHELLNFEYIDPEIRKIIYRQGIDEEKFFALMIEEDRICGEIAKELLPHIAKDFLGNYFVITTLGFVRSVATEKFGLSVIALVMYAVVIGFIIYAVVQKKAKKQYVAMLFVLITICGTVCGTSLVIQCMGRYMIYNLPFFYIIGMALIQTLFVDSNNKG